MKTFKQFLRESKQLKENDEIEFELLNSNQTAAAKANKSNKTFTVIMVDTDARKMTKKTIKALDGFDAIVSVYGKNNWFDSDDVKDAFKKEYDIYLKGDVDKAIKEVSKRMISGDDPSDSDYHIYQILDGSKVIYDDTYWKGYPNQGQWKKVSIYD